MLSARSALFALLCACSACGPFNAVFAAPSAPVPQQATPMLVRNNGRLFVPQDSPLRARLEVAPVGEHASPHEVELPAVVEADPATTINVLPPATGRLVELKVRLGDVVQRGQLLATVSSPDFAQAVADEQKARDALDLARRALERARGVNESGSNATKDVEAAESAMVQQTAELQRAQARLRSLGAAPAAGTPASAGTGGSGLLRIVAPTRGTVTALSAGPGANLNDVTVALMTIANLEHVWITVNVPEGLLGQVGPGQSASVGLPAYPGRVFEGRLAFVGALLDADTRRAKARIVFANPQGLLRPNMFATARIGLPEAPQPEVPTSALLMNNDSVSVLVEVEPWTFVRRGVELGREDDGRVRIRSGLKTGERVIVRGGVLLND